MSKHAQIKHCRVCRDPRRQPSFGDTLIVSFRDDVYPAQALLEGSGDHGLSVLRMMSPVQTPSHCSSAATSQLRFYRDDSSSSSSSHDGLKSVAPPQLLFRDAFVFRGACLEISDDDGFEILSTLSGEALIGTTYFHPLYESKSPVLAGGDLHY